MQHIRPYIISVFLLLHGIPNITAVPVGCDSYVDLFFIVDASESIRDDDPYESELYQWELIKDFLTQVVKQLPISPAQCQMGILKYSDGVHLEFNMQQYRRASDIETYIKQRLIHVGGNTNTAEALSKAYDYLYDSRFGQRFDARKVIVLLTDGLSNRNQYMTIPQADDLKRYGTEIFVVAMEQIVDESELLAIASPPTSLHLIIASYATNADELVTFTVYGICNLPLPEPTPPNCDVGMDLAIVLDNSGSIKVEASDSFLNQNYDNLKKFVKSLLDTIEIGETKTKVGMIKFSDYSTTVFKLKDFTDKERMKVAIDEMQFDGGYTNISGALRQARQHIFTPQNGDRLGIRNVMIIIADGESNIDPQLTASEANQLKMEGIQIYVVAVLTTKFDETELKDIASDPDVDHYFNSPSIENLPTIRDNLLKHVCGQETLLQGIADHNPMNSPSSNAK